jgi:CO dehydrogenase maturation factor
MITIAVSGKGGVGKTSVSAMMIRWLSENVTNSVLAVDADSNVNLNDMLGIELKDTIGSIREEMKDKVNNLPGGMTKQQFLDYKIQSSLVENKNFDMIAMGRPEGPGCYCYANSVLRDILKELAKNYQIVLIDNEAGMEHLSRRTAQDIDYLFIVTDPIVRGIETAAKINTLLRELETRVKERYLILNRVKSKISDKVMDIINKEGLELIAKIPDDEKLSEMDSIGEPIWSLENSLAYNAIDELMKKLNFKK